MHNFTYIELVLILGLYYFDKGRQVESFTIKFNQFFNKDVGTQTILFSLSIYKGVDPSNNKKAAQNNSLYYDIWREYIERDKLKELKEIYRSFKNGTFQSKVYYSNEDESVIDEMLNLPSKSIIKDTPKPKPSFVASKEKHEYPRDKSVAINALFHANFTCEAKCGNELFLRKNCDKNFTEAHHLIPLGYQNCFNYSLDVESNVVSLCPHCHSKLHYGRDYERTLKHLYINRQKRLQACGIVIGFESLLLLYR